MYDRGIYYIATGDLHNEARKSANRVREICDYPIAVATDRPEKASEWADTTIRIDDPEFGFGDKPTNMHRTPFNESIYIDTDTWVVHSDALDELFDILKRVDLAGALDTGRRADYISSVEIDSGDIDAAKSFPMMNTGILAFRTQNIQNLLSEWQKSHFEHSSLVKTHTSVV